MLSTLLDFSLSWPGMMYDVCRYLLSTYYTPGTVLGSRDTAVNKTGKHPSLQGVGIQYGGGDSEQVDKRATDISVCEND